MMDENEALRVLIDKDAIRNLVLLYCRSIDRKDVALLRTLYTDDATDSHAGDYDGDVEGFCAFIARSAPYAAYFGHHVCNHLIAVNGSTAEGEVYAIACHLIPDGAGGLAEDVRLVRYIDQYRKDDGQWRFSRRVVTYDYRTQRPAQAKPAAVSDGSDDPSYGLLESRLFARGARA